MYLVYKLSTLPGQILRFTHYRQHLSWGLACSRSLK